MIVGVVTVCLTALSIWISIDARRSQRALNGDWSRELHDFDAR